MRRWRRRSCKRRQGEGSGAGGCGGDYYDAEGEAFVGVGVGLGEGVGGGGGEVGGGLDAGVVVLRYFDGLVIDVPVADTAVGGAVRGSG